MKQHDSYEQAEVQSPTSKLFQSVAVDREQIYNAVGDDTALPIKGRAKLLEHLGFFL